MKRHPIIADDCARALACTSARLWAGLSDSRIFVTGGTGFFGTWLLELFTAAVDRHGLRSEATVLTRDPEAFVAGPAGHLARHPAIRLWRGDVREFAFPEGSFQYVAHFASTGPKHWHDTDPAGFESVAIEGTRRVLEFARRCGARRLLAASSGAVYGSILPDSPVRETFSPALGGLTSVNARAKAALEQMVIEASRDQALSVAIARGFAFVGPYLPSQSGFAAYDFIQDAVAARSVTVAGDGTPVRSYLYASDLGVWLWTLLLRAAGNTVWNVGSEIPVTIGELAREVAAAATPSLAVDVQRKPTPNHNASWYVPCTERARRELGLRQTVSLRPAIQRTLAWHQSSVLATA